MIVRLLLVFVVFSACNDAVKSNPLAPEESIESLTAFAKANINESANSCENFYKFSCGNWQHKKPIATRLPEQSMVKSFHFRVDSLIEDFLKTSAEHDDNSAEGKAKKFHSSCLRSQSMFRQTLNNFIRNRIPSNRTKIDWIVGNFLFKEFGGEPFIGVKFGKNGISLKYSNHNWFNRTIRNLRSLRLYTTSEFDENLEKSQQLHNRLMSLSGSQVPTTTTVADFIETRKDDPIDWSRFFELALNGTTQTAENLQIESFLENSNQFANIMNQTEMETLLFYVTANFISAYLDLFQQEMWIHHDVISCFHLTKKYFQLALVPYLLEQIENTDDWRRDTLAISGQIKAKLAAHIDRIQSIDEATKDATKTKLNELRVIIGYVDEMTDRSALDSRYESLNISDTNLWENFLNLKRMESADLRNDAIPRTAFSFAHYFPEQNIVSIPLQYWQTPFNYGKFPDSMNFGGIAFLLAHEMAHALRGSVSLSVAADNNETCSTSEDRIGARIAYDLFAERLSRENGERTEKPVDGLQFTAKEFFFLQLAQTVCTGAVDDDLAKKVINQFSPNDENRVNGIVRNMPEFSEIYQCSAGAEMNPEEKCSVW